MAFQFRFPIAILHYLDSDQSPFGYQNAIEKAREFAKPLTEEKRKRPSLLEAEAYVNEIVKTKQEEKDDRMARKEY